jgi:hypothetical protein
VTGTVPTTDGLDPAPAAAPTAAASPFVVVGGDAALCEGDVCAVPTAPDAPGGVLPLAAPPAT